MTPDRSNIVVEAPIRWSAQEVRARKEIRKAFEADENHQWLIGDLLNMIAPSVGPGAWASDPDGVRKLRLVAEENDRDTTTLKHYRQVASTFSVGHRGHAFTLCRLATFAWGDDAPQKLEAFVADRNGKASVNDLREFLGQSTPNKKNQRFSVVSAYDAFHAFATKEDVQVDDQDKVLLRMMKLDIEVLLGDEG